MSFAAVTPTPKKRGPKTLEGKARSRTNALRHGLRARTFALLPEESAAEWAEHMADLRRCYGPVDAVEEKLVATIAAAMWNEIRADRTLAEVLAAIPPLAEGRPHGGDLQEPGHALSVNTAIRYMTAASMASQRAQRAFLQHRKAKQAGLILAAEEPVKQVVAQDCTNELSPARQTLAQNDAAAGERASGAEESAPAPTLNRHHRRRCEAMAREAQRRAA